MSNHTCRCVTADARESDAIPYVAQSKTGRRLNDFSREQGRRQTRIKNNSHHSHIGISPVPALDIEPRVLRAARSLIDLTAGRLSNARLAPVYVHGRLETRATLGPAV